MKKILLLLLIFFSGILFYMYKFNIEKKIDNYIIIETEFVNNPRLYCKGYLEIKLMDKDSNQEIKKYNNFIEGLYVVGKGNYRVEVPYNNEVIIRDLEKHEGKSLKYRFFGSVKKVV